MDFKRYYKNINQAIEKKPREFEAYSALFDVIREYEKENFEQAHKWNQDIRSKIVYGLQKSIVLKCRT